MTIQDVMTAVAIGGLVGFVCSLAARVGRGSLRGHNLTLTASNLYGVDRRWPPCPRWWFRWWPGDGWVREECARKVRMLSPHPRDVAAAVLRVPVRQEGEGWAVVLVARRPWWRRRVTWRRMVDDAQQAVDDVRPVAITVEVRG